MKHPFKHHKKDEVEKDLKEPQEEAPEEEAPQEEVQPQEEELPAEEPEVEEKDLQDELGKALNKAAENYDLYIRARAEADNVRRRAAEDVAKAHKFGIERFAEALLPVVDSLEKAIEASANDEGHLKEGLEVTYRQMLNALENNGMKSENPIGLKFDPNTMQAIAMIDSEEVQSGCVAQVFQKGWKIADRVLRAAMVAVAK